MLKMIASLFILALSAHVWSSDLTSVYRTQLKPIEQVDRTSLQKYKVIIVPGVLAESFISNSSNQIKLGFIFDEAFKEQIKLLNTLKVDYEFLNLESENSPEKNAKYIIEAIERSLLPVLIYAHSKGGLDVLEAIRQKPNLLSKIHGWASIQSPFWGAPVASSFSSNDILLGASNKLFEWMGGDAGGMSSLTIEERTSYMQSENIQSLLLDINKKIIFLNYASYKTNTTGIHTPLELFRNFTDQVAGKNDGVVPVSSALMKDHGIDINYIIETEVDHLMTMTHFRLNNSDYNQQSHTLAILKLLL
jgi:glutaredoxin